MPNFQWSNQFLKDSRPILSFQMLVLPISDVTVEKKTEWQLLFHANFKARISFCSCHISYWVFCNQLLNMLITQEFIQTISSMWVHFFTFFNNSRIVVGLDCRWCRSGGRVLSNQTWLAACSSFVPSVTSSFSSGVTTVVCPFTCSPVESERKYRDNHSN